MIIKYESNYENVKSRNCVYFLCMGLKTVNHSFFRHFFRFGGFCFFQEDELLNITRAKCFLKYGTVIVLLQSYDKMTLLGQNNNNICRVNSVYLPHGKDILFSLLEI